jgi:uncharacterized RDD family membrane protein YckC
MAMYCGSCGRNNPDGARFCGACGGQLAPPATGPAGGAAAGPAPAYQPPAGSPPPQSPGYGADAPVNQPPYDAGAWAPPVSPTYDAPPPPYQQPAAYGQQAPPAYQPPLSPPYDAPPYQQQPPGAYPYPQPSYQPPLLLQPQSAGRMVAGYRVSGLGIRFLAAFLDSVLVTIIYFVVGIAVGARTGGLGDHGFDLHGQSAVITIGLTLAASIAYYWLLEGLFGATLGKAMMGIQVRDDGGGRCSLGESLIRNALRLVDGIGGYLVGLVAALSSKNRQRLGDMAARTVVVVNPLSGGARAGLSIVWLVALAGGITGAVLVYNNASPLAGIKGPFKLLPADIRGASTGRLVAGNLAFLQSKGGPERATGPYRPGDTVYVKYDIAGYAVDDNGAPNLAIEMQGIDPYGMALHEPWGVQFHDAIEHGTPVNGSLYIQLPYLAPSGTYKIPVRIHDRLANTDLQFTPTFQVEAPAVAPANAVEIRGLELSASENGPSDPALVISPGATVYMRCSVFGLRVQNNAISGMMGLKVIGPTGELLLDKPDYFNMTNHVAYHPPVFWIPITGHLSTPTGMPPGHYIEQFSVIDYLSQQTAVQQIGFDIR